jgi:uncharacterized GH25 family protein
MRRMPFAFAAVLVVTAAATAHMIYIVPDKAERTKAVVIFSDSLEPDTNVKPESFDKVDAGRLFAHGPDFKKMPLQHTRDGHTLKVALPAGVTVVYGEVAYGVSQRGTDKARLLTYYPKAIVGPIPPDGGQTGAAVELVPVIEGSKVRFKALAKGKPLAKAEVSVTAAGKEAVKLTTDDAGLTPATEGSGRYAASVRHTTETPGEAAGKKYDVVADYATLVVDVK